MATTLNDEGVLHGDGTLVTNYITGTRVIFGYGLNNSLVRVSITNLVNNYGGVATDTTGVGTSRSTLAAAGYGGDKAIFGYGASGSATAVTNLVSNIGVVSNDVTGIGTARYGLAAASYSS